MANFTDYDFSRINQMFQSDEQVDNLIMRLQEYYQTTNPVSMPSRYRGFYLDENDQLVFVKGAARRNRRKPEAPEGPRLQIARPSDVPSILAKMYKEDMNASLGKGVNSLYKYVRSQWGGITRQDVEAFLKGQPLHQLTKQTNSVVKRPITAAYPNQVWSVDLLDVSMFKRSNHGKSYVFVCVDIFSRFTFLEGMQGKEATEARDALVRIVQRAGVRPSSIRCDRGLEFHGAFADWCKAQEPAIPVIYSQSHSPTQNAVVERANKEVRKIMAALFVQTRAKNWTAHLLQIEEAKNTAYNGSIRAAPVHVWTPTNTKQPVRVAETARESQNAQERAQYHHVHRQRRAKERYEDQDNFQVGDKVRVLLTELLADQRKLTKMGLGKQFSVLYSPVIYTVAGVRNSRVGHKTYSLGNANGDLLSLQNRGKTFKADALQRVGAQEQPANLSWNDVFRLNGIKPNQNDVVGI